MEQGTKSGVSSAKMVKEIGKILVVAILVYFVFLMASVLMSDGVKYIYCLSDDKCVTVWKKSNGEVYLIPDRYESDEKPTGSHIKTISRQFLTLYFSNGEGFSDKIIVRDGGNLRTNRKMYSIENDSTGKWEFVEYSDTLGALLYKPSATKFKDVNEGVDYLIINIDENYAIDKTGEDRH
ncbi:hypothetical protein DSL64_21420 [Dyadobacter luteus]|uniref:Uncharacterized protein n=1 Tax=Dyadobacter luteus TaxID=2259619 RepID=A0A3D8Y5Z1_9BACT|nr:hypothetical protein [Dyadobacter luteus]REA58170.1 hypothetical protein DSL64_21420 [Dyadobacter luteus]